MINKLDLLVISPYPSENKYSHPTSALASFTKNLIDGLRKVNPKLRIIILADNDNKKDKARKVWKKGDLKLYFSLLKEIRLYSAKKILIQFEWSVFGSSFFFIALFPFFLLGLRFLRKQPIVVLHGVNFDFRPLFKQKIKSYLLNFGSLIFYFLSCAFSKKVIVNENYFKNRLIKKFPLFSNKIEFIPHGVDTEIIFKEKRKRIDKKLNLAYFGYLHPYKGPERLLDLFVKLKDPSLKLFFFGGESPSLQKNLEYKNYLKKIYRAAKIHKIYISGFLGENKLQQAFEICDLIIFPYVIFISSSGMLALTFSFEKPFILSRPLEGYFESSDFKEALKKTGLRNEDFIFDFTKESFEKRLEWAKKNLKRLSQFSRFMKQKRSWDKVAKMYLSVLKEEN